MFRSLFVPLDGSPFGEQALPMALALAGRADSAIEVGHVHVPLTGMYPESSVVIDPALENSTRDQERAYLDKIVQQLQTRKAGSVTAVLLEGPIVDSIHEHTAAKGVDLVVMTTHGRGPLARFWLGSVADKLLRKLPIPLLLVRPQEGPVDPTAVPTLRKILVTLDGSEFAEQVLEPALTLSGLLGAELLLLRVVKPPFFAWQDAAGLVVPTPGVDLLWETEKLQRQLEDEAWSYLEKVAGQFQARDRHVVTHVVTHAQPAQAILDEIQAQGVDLVALATHGRGGFRRAMLGSVADKVLRGSHVPLLVYRPLAK